MHLLLFGILLGMGAAIPIGPVNLEMIRRNLRFGTHYGIMTGLGACTADLTYLILLCLGALTLLQYPDVLRGLGLVGSLVLGWFGINAFRSKLTDIPEQNKSPSLFRFSLEGYLITLINPYTILFWASISSQLSMIAASHDYTILLAGTGVIVGAAAWVFILNGFLHFTRHRLSKKAIHRLNYVGGVILLGFAAIGLIRVARF
ncbi:MAG: LysE family translocator [Gammaproteobacteria bacterium]|nr:LysE family translocator [Gammaproteobacteria bacterium]